MTTTSNTRGPARGAALFLGTLAFLALPCLAQTQTEGYDPLRQITAQVTRANLLIVLDTTGSMAWDVEGESVGQDSTGQNPTMAWSRTSSGCARYTSTPCTTWSYVLTLNQKWPSRIATVKNALGSSVTIITPWGYPSTWPALGTLPSGATVTGPSFSASATARTWTWTVTFATQVADPYLGKVPFTAYDASGVPTVGTPSVTVPPQDVIGKNANRVNWGLVAFSDSRGDCTKQAFVVPMDTTDQGDVQILEAYMNLAATTTTISGTTYNGLDTGGGTPTIGALVQAKDVLSKTFSGGTVSTYKLDGSNASKVLTADPRAACDRTYGVILVTDGMSNSCNAPGTTVADKNWMNRPCAICDQLQPAGSSSVYDCPNSYTIYAAGKSEAIWGLNLSNAARVATGRSPITPRTWVIGVSPVVGPCELNYIAYEGRTDADSPNNDAGFATANDPRLPGGSPGTYVGPNGRGTYPTGADTTKNYAFFATTASQINTAFAAIVNATATGDYSTSAPLSGAGAAASNIVTLPSTSFPDWKGHYYGYDSAVTKAQYDADNTKCYRWLSECYGGTATDNTPNPCIPCMKWDAGHLLTEAITPAASRKIYTWDPANSNALVEVTAGNLATLQGIAPGLTAAHVDFIRGNDGTGTARPWRLGPMINTTPALISAPLPYSQNTVSAAHDQFRSDQSNRTPLVWVGANDGMLHAFRLADGIEQVALLPPGILPNELVLYDNYKNLGGSVTGQLADTTAHVYGVANSLRFSDVYFPAVGSIPATFKTVGYLAVGPAAAELTAIDLTHPSPSDFGYGFGDSVNNPPVKILWRKTNGSGTNQLPGLFQTWSLPALAPVTSDTYRLIVGGGFNKTNTQAEQVKTSGSAFVNPVYYVLSPVDGSLIGTKTITSTTGVASPPTLVGNQAFADSVFIRTVAKYYQEDNLADLGLQADLNGRIWFASGGTDFPTSAIGINLPAKVTTTQQPIYYPPAASGYGAPGKGCDVFAFASGTLYERSSKITGPNIGTSTTFEPSLYTATSPKPSTPGSPPTVSVANISRTLINTLVAPACPASPPPNQPPCVVDPNAGHTLHNGSQATAPPYLLVSKDGTATSKAFFLVYDPTNGCNGFSYVVELDVSNDASCAPTVTTVIHAGGIGAASGFTITDDKVRVAKSGIGLGATASIWTVPGAAPTSGGSLSVVPLWWRELK